MKRLMGIAGLAHAGAIKADPLAYALAVAVFSAAAAPPEVLDDGWLLFWLVLGSMCGFCYALFKDDKKPLTPRGALSKLVTCFIPGFCFTGLGIVISKLQATPSIVLALSLALSIAGVTIVDAVTKRIEKKIGGEQ
jgi:hypothetical protein